MRGLSLGLSWAERRKERELERESHDLSEGIIFCLAFVVGGVSPVAENAHSSLQAVCLFASLHILFLVEELKGRQCTEHLKIALLYR